MSRARILADYVSSGDELADKAPLASPDFTGTVDLTGTTVSLDDDEISLDKVNGGTLGTGTIGGSSVVNTSGAITTTGVAAVGSSSTSGSHLRVHQATTGTDALRITGGNAANVDMVSILVDQATGSAFDFINCERDSDGTPASAFKVTGESKVGIGNSSPDHEFVIGPVLPGSDIENTIEMRGSAGDQSLQRFHLVNKGDSGRIDFKLGRSGSAPSTKMTIEPSDDITINSGNLLVTGSGKGIGFGSEIMDDYEEFTWNPGMRTGSYLHFSTSYTTKGVKIGRFVHMTIYGTMTATGSAGADSLYAASTLPYPAGASTGDPVVYVGVGKGSGSGSAFGPFHNYYGNALGSGAMTGSHSTDDALHFSIQLTYYTDN